MDQHELERIIGNLNDTCTKALSEAGNVAISNRHYEVEIEHVFLQLLENERSQFNAILGRFNANKAKLVSALKKFVRDCRTGSGRNPRYAPQLVSMFEKGWLLASMQLHLPKVTSGCLLVCAMEDRDCRSLLIDTSNEWRLLVDDGLKSVLAELIDQGVEVERRPAPDDQGKALTEIDEDSALARFTIDITDQARSGKLGPVLERDQETRQLIEILSGRGKNNAILTGEAGVGKTAVVEGLAHRIAAGDVPPALRNISIRLLDFTLLQAGAAVRGEFENRLKTLLQEIKLLPTPVVLFIDEAHMMIGAGGAAGQGDAANLLKPALARGELRSIAATTWSEYKKYIEKDKALARRFQVVKVEEPDEPRAIAMVRGWARKWEEQYKVRILDDAISDSVILSSRYLPESQLPDKAARVLERACVTVSLGKDLAPPALEDAYQTLRRVQEEIEFLEVESRIGHDHAARLALLQARNEELLSLSQELRAKWTRQCELVTEIRDVQERLATRQLTTDSADDEAKLAEDSRGPLRARLRELQQNLADAQAGDQAIVQACVDGESVRDIISRETGIPLKKMVRKEIDTLLGLKDALAARVLGQDPAIESIVQRIYIARAGLEDAGKPVGSFLLVGPSGVGKTETALALADLLYGGEKSVITINMSEYKEKHRVALLFGAPPGYIGHGEGGVLTDAVRRKPYSVILLDEIEKADPSVLDVFLQVFDKGIMEDSEKRTIHFKNTIIMLTSNIGARTIAKLCARPGGSPSWNELLEAIRPDLYGQLKQEFVGRLTVVPYYAISNETMRNIIRLKFRKIQDRAHAAHGVSMQVADNVIDHVLNRCNDGAVGARAIDQILSSTVLPELGKQLLSRMGSGVTAKEVVVSSDSDGRIVCEVN